MFWRITNNLEISFQGTAGITNADLKKLADAGYHTVESIAYSLKKQIMTVKGISDTKAEKLIAEASKLGTMMNFYCSRGFSKVYLF